MPGGSRSNAREVVAALLAGGKTIAGVAEAAGVSERTVRRWRGEAEFREMVAALRSEAIAEATGVLKAATVQAAGVLAELLSDERAGIRLQASRSVIELALALRASEEFERRIVELELLLAARAKA
jgi:hypothetical protein